MTTSERIISEALALPPAERLAVIEQLWDSLGATSDELDLTEAQRQELDRRIAEMDAHPDLGIPWHDVKAERRKQR